MPVPPGFDAISSFDWPDMHTDDGSAFTLNSMLIAPPNPGDYPIQLLGYDNGVLVDYAQSSSADPLTGLLTLNWTNIDGIIFFGDIHGVFLDNIVVNEPTTAAPTPEPSTLVLAGTGLAGLLAAARRRNWSKPESGGGKAVGKSAVPTLNSNKASSGASEASRKICSPHARHATAVLSVAAHAPDHRR